MTESKNNNDKNEKKLVLPPEVEAKMRKEDEEKLAEQKNAQAKAAKDSKSKKDKPLDDKDEIKRLQQELIKKDKEFLLLKAEFSNYQKRQRKFEEERAKYAIQGLVLELLPQLDTYEQALNSEKSVDSMKLLEGFSMIFSMFKKVLNNFSIKEIEVKKGDIINPELHEVMFTVEDPEKSSNTVAQIIQKGYILHNRVIRAVKVASVQNPAPAKPEKEIIDVEKPEVVEEIEKIDIVDKNNVEKNDVSEKSDNTEKNDTNEKI